EPTSGSSPATAAARRRIPPSPTWPWPPTRGRSRRAPRAGLTATANTTNCSASRRNSAEPPNTEPPSGSEAELHDEPHRPLVFPRDALPGGTVHPARGFWPVGHRAAFFHFLWPPRLPAYHRPFDAQDAPGLRDRPDADSVSFFP